MIGGEWTPRYLVSHWTPPLLKQAAPDARLLVMLRDPVDRFCSGMNFGMRDKCPELTHEHFLRGFYGAQLSLWMRHFDPNQILVLQYERRQRQTQAECSRAHFPNHAAVGQGYYFCEPECKSEWRRWELSPRGRTSQTLQVARASGGECGSDACGLLPV